MSAETDIRSSSNPIVKLARAVARGKQPGLIALEGDRLVDDALASGLVFRHVLVDDARGERAAELAAAGLPVARLAGGLLDRISALVTSPGVLGIAESPVSVELERLAIDERTLWLVVDGLQNPGNLGALARSAEAAGVSALLVVRSAQHGGVSPWSPKALRGSMGSLLRLPVHETGDGAALARRLTERGVRPFAAATRGGVRLESFDFRGPRAFWVGAETGDDEHARGFERVTIPMAGAVESLNVTVAASIVLFAAGRAQSGGKPGAGA